MLQKLIKKIRRKLTKIKVLESFFIDGVEYRVVETTSILPSIKNKRSLSFKKDDKIYHHSSIYLNPKHHFQPVYKTMQSIVDSWGKFNNIDNALILGCAGCSFPRFLSLHYPECKTTGIEISKEFIDIAKKHFLLDEIAGQFELIHADAFDFIENNPQSELRDLIYVDIFDSNKLIDEVFSEQFINSLSLCTSENSIVIFNLLGKPESELISFAEKIGSSYDGKYIWSQQNSTPLGVLVLVKTTSPENLQKFEKDSEKSNIILKKIENK